MTSQNHQGERSSRLKISILPRDVGDLYRDSKGREGRRRREGGGGFQPLPSSSSSTSIAFVLSSQPEGITSSGESNKPLLLVRARSATSDCLIIPSKVTSCSNVSHLQFPKMKYTRHPPPFPQFSLLPNFRHASSRRPWSSSGVRT